MDKQQVADLLQKQLGEIPSLKELNPEDSKFELWKENCLTLFKQFFSDERRWIDNFEWSSYHVNRIKFEEEVGIYTQEDKEAYEKGLQGAEVAIKAALNKLALFGVKPQVEQAPSGHKGVTVLITNNLTNQQSTQLSVNFDQIIENIQSSDKSAEEKEEAKGKINELKEEVSKPNPSWDRIKSILKWLLDFGKDIFIQTIPYILEKYGH